MTREFAGLTGDLIERRVAGVLGPALPRPDRLALLQAPGTGRGRVGRALLGWLAPVEGSAGAATACRRIAVTPGIDVLIDEQHPVIRLNGDVAAIAEAFRQALAGLVAP
jgi:hypothetical protein